MLCLSYDNRFNFWPGCGGVKVEFMHYKYIRKVLMQYRCRLGPFCPNLQIIENIL
jgi:hypothetical protein